MLGPSINTVNRDAGVAAVARALPWLDDARNLSGPERDVILACRRSETVAELDLAIEPAGDDPFTDALAQGRHAEARRDLGQFFTPWPVVNVMVGLRELAGRAPGTDLRQCA